MTKFRAEARRLRKERGLTLTKMAEGIGISPAFVSKAETGKALISPRLVNGMIELFGLGREDAEALRAMAKEANDEYRRRMYSL